MAHTLWNLILSLLVIGTGVFLLLRWLGSAGLALPLSGKHCQSAACCTVDRGEVMRVFAGALGFRILVFALVGVLTCFMLSPGAGAQAALSTWQRWDALHYVNLAKLGYSGYVEDGQHLFLVFFPLYPWLMRLVSWLTGNTIAAGLLISFFAYSLGCVYLYRIAAWEWGREVAVRSVVLLSVFPYSFFFGGVMTEGLFLLTTAAALWHIRQHHWLAAGLWGILAAMTRMHGLLLVGVAAAELVEWLGGFRWREILRRIPALLLPVLGTLVYLGLNQAVAGAPFAFTIMQKHWSQGFCWISETLWYVLQNALTYYDEAIRWQIWIPTLILFPLFFALLWYGAQRVRNMYALYGFVCLVLDYSLSWLLSAGRYLSCALPFFFFAAVLCSKRRGLFPLLTCAMGAGFLINLAIYLTGGQIM